MRINNVPGAKDPLLTHYPVLISFLHVVSEMGPCQVISPDMVFQDGRFRYFMREDTSKEIVRICVDFPGVIKEDIIPFNQILPTRV